jgi:hypothetical protein
MLPSVSASGGAELEESRGLFYAKYPEKYPDMIPNPISACHW